MQQIKHPEPASENNRIQFRLTGPSVKLDPRIHAARHDLADVSLAGILFAPHYAKAQATVCSAASAFVRGTNSDTASAVTQLLHGETFHVLDITGNWAWGYCDHDGYVGYVARQTLTLPSVAPEFRVVGTGAPLFTQPDIKSPVSAILPRGSQIAGMREGDFIIAPEGYVHAAHLESLTAPASCWVEEAKAYLGQPYVWGGRGAGGIDCSGLVQVALGACGIKVPRDSDLQRDGIGTLLPKGEKLAQGDLVFFPGHVGIMSDAETLLHANAHHMRVVEEPLTDVITRLQPQFPDPVLACRRVRA